MALMGCVTSDKFLSLCITKSREESLTLYLEWGTPEDSLFPVPSHFKSAQHYS